MSSVLIGQRLKALREKKGLLQDELARLLGFKDRQTVSAIENGERRLSADELLLAVQKLGVSLEDFTDPFRLAGEGHFNWRRTDVPAEALCAHERFAGQLIAVFRTLGADLGEKPPLLRSSLTLTKNWRFEEAAQAGERFAAEHGLGDTPAQNLAEVMESDLKILVLAIKPNHAGISGAACRLPDLDVVLINRDEPPGRRHFDLAHELFHILTWDALKPEHTEDVTEVGGSRIEQLANAFAAALLMPASLVEKHADWRTLRDEALIRALNSTADHLQVTATALLWRLVGLGHLNKVEARAIPADAIRHNGRLVRHIAPPLFSKRFVEIVARAVDEGRVSTRKIAGLLNLTVDELGELFVAYGVQAPYDL